MIASIFPELSIMIPAYNEERRLPRGLTKFASISLAAALLRPGALPRSISELSDYVRGLFYIRLDWLIGRYLTRHSEESQSHSFGFAVGGTRPFIRKYIAAMP